MYHSMDLVHVRQQKPLNIQKQADTRVAAEPYVPAANS